MVYEGPLVARSDSAVAYYSLKHYIISQSREAASKIQRTEIFVPRATFR